MGHVEKYHFTDPRDGDFGTNYSFNSFSEAQIKAAEMGYSGPINKTVRSYPPAPDKYHLTVDAKGRIERVDGDIPF